ncbi:MAG: carboxypeptidase-like regulatory domain-containing protein, partial [Pseudomonadota bacterium]
MLTLLAVIGLEPALAQTAPGVQIINRAYVSYGPAPVQPVVVPSNDASVTTAVIRSNSGLELLRINGVDSLNGQSLGPAACVQPGGVNVLPYTGTSGGIPLDGTTSYSFALATSYNVGEPIIVRLVDADQNLDFQTVDLADVTLGIPSTGDTETVQLTETGPNTGIFTGFLPSDTTSAAGGDCTLQGATDTLLVANYADPADGADQSSVNALLDPSGVTFDSRSGEPLDGVRITLIDAATGLPAAVTGSDGVSGFPSEIVTGSVVTDAGGQSYDFANGHFRFPNVPAGDYRLLVESPNGYLAPTRFTESDLQSLPGAPYLLNAGSFGNTFTQTTDGPLSIDFPLDSQDVSLFVQKTSLTTSA